MNIQNKEYHDLFVEIISSNLEQILKILPKKHSNLKEKCLKNLSELKKGNLILSFSQYLLFYKPFLEVKNSKIYELFIECIEVVLFFNLSKNFAKKLLSYFPQDSAMTNNCVIIDMNLIYQMMSIFPSEMEEIFYPKFLKFCQELIRVSKVSVEKQNFELLIKTLFSAFLSKKKMEKI